MIHLYRDEERTACNLEIESGVLDTYTKRGGEPVTRTPGATNCYDCAEARDADPGLYAAR